MRVSKALGIVLFVTGAVLGLGAMPAAAYECVPCPVSCKPSNPDCEPPPSCSIFPIPPPQCKRLDAGDENALPAELWLSGAVAW